MKFYLLTGLIYFILSSFALSRVQAASQETQFDPTGAQTDLQPGQENVIGQSVEEDEDGEGQERNFFNLNYFGILFGPSISNPNSYQPTSTGVSDLNRPVILKNFLNIGHDFDQNVSIYGSVNWILQPVLNKGMQLGDPFVRVTYNSIFNQGGWNLYGDLRAHFPVTDTSRDCDLLFGLQSFQALTYRVPASRLTLGVYTSERGNLFGKYGYGNDLELYIAPNLYYQISPTMAVTLLYELQRDHFYGMSPFPLLNDGTDIAPGFSWDITPKLTVNPYLNILTNNQISLSSTSIGMMVNLLLL